MRHEDIWELYESGDLEALLQGFEDVESLDMFLNAMMENSQDLGVDPQLIERRLEDVNFEMARKHRLDDRDVMFLTKQVMEQFDRPVACDILRGHVMAVGALIGRKLAEDGDTSA